MRAFRSATAPAHHAVAWATLVLLAGGAQAQTLQTITVTAERRSENILDVPSAVSTLSGEALDVLNSSGEDVRLLSGRVPSLNIESSFGRAFPRFYIRGYGNTDFRLNASQPVSLVYDDVVQENPILKGFPIFDLEAVEVLAGPQGSLFGRNTPAGVVKFESVRPSQRQEGYVTGTLGRYGTVAVEGAYTLPLTPTWSTRLAVQVQHRDDWVHNTYAAGPTQGFEGYDDSAARLQALYQPGRDFSALFNIHLRDLKGSARLFRANIIEPGTNELVAGFNPAEVSLDGKNRQTLTTAGGSVRLKWAFGGFDLYSITGLETVRSDSRGDIDGGFGASYAPPYGPGFIPFSSETSDAMRDHKQWTQEIRAESTAPGPFRWQGGLYYFHEDYAVDSKNFDSTSGGVETGLLTTSQKSKSWALFGSIAYDLTSMLELRGGLRYTHDSKRLNVVADYPIQDQNGLGTTTSDSKVSWDLSASYKVATDAKVYARVATGYRGSSILPPGAFNPISTAKPETITSIEVGTKADLLNKRVRVAADVFRYEVKDQQLTEVGGGGNSNSLKTAKKVVGQGLEFSLDAYLTDRLLLSLSGSVNDTEIQDKSLEVFGCGGGCTVTDPAGPNGGVLIDGNPLPQAPKYIANVNLRYSIPTASGEWYVYTDWSYRSKINFFLYESVEFTGKALTTGGLRVGYLWGNGKYEAAVFGRNITNQTRIVGGIDFNNLTGFINEPRTWGVQFKALF